MTDSYRKTRKELLSALLRVYQSLHDTYNKVGYSALALDYRCKFHLSAHQSRDGHMPSLELYFRKVDTYNQLLRQRFA